MNKAYLIWATGIPCSGKTTLMDELSKVLNTMNISNQRLDGDIVRGKLWKDLRFSKEDRNENLRRVTELSKLFLKQGIWVLASFVSPYRAIREKIRKEVSKNLEEKRLLLKAPALSFAVSILPKIFLEPKIIAIYRNPIGVINSFKHRVPKFKLEEVINKWNETIDYVEKCRKNTDFYTLNYLDLINNPAKELKKIFTYCELPLEKYIYSINLKPSKTKIILTEMEMYKIMEKVYEN